MSSHERSYPNETPEYRAAREALLHEEVALRTQMERVAAQRRELPLGGVAPDYEFDTSVGPQSLDQLFGDQQTLIVYSFMYGGDQTSPCPMCSAFLDSVCGQIEHIQQRAAFVVVARNTLSQLHKLAAARQWQAADWVSAANNSYPVDYHSEMPNGVQVPMANVFRKVEGTVYHSWAAELFFAPSETHPRHIDLLWPLWNFFDLTPEGRGDFLPKLNY